MELRYNGLQEGTKQGAFWESGFSEPFESLAPGVGCDVGEASEEETESCLGERSEGDQSEQSVGEEVALVGLEVGQEWLQECADRV